MIVSTSKRTAGQKLCRCTATTASGKRCALPANRIGPHGNRVCHRHAATTK